MDDKNPMMPTFLGQSMAGSRPGDPVADYLGGHASKSSLQMLVNMLLGVGAGAGAASSFASGNPILGTPLLYATKNRADAFSQNVDDANRYIGAVKGFDRMGLPAGPQTPGRFAVPGLLGD